MRGVRVDGSLRALKSSEHSIFFVKNVSKTFFIPNPDLGGEVIESLHDIVGVGLRYFLYNIIEGGVIEPHCPQLKGPIVGVWRWLVSVDK